MYFLIPRLFGQKKMYSVQAIELHFWIATIGIVLYIAAMWIAGVMQGLMWRAINADGTLDLHLCRKRQSHLSVLCGALCWAACCTWAACWSCCGTSLHDRDVRARSVSRRHSRCRRARLRRI
jgi:cbb3-type cytochrome oxidase subunit 1